MTQPTKNKGTSCQYCGRFTLKECSTCEQLVDIIDYDPQECPCQCHIEKKCKHDFVCNGKCSTFIPPHPQEKCKEGSHIFETEDSLYCKCSHPQATASLVNEDGSPLKEVEGWEMGEVMEELSDKEHTRWANWQRWVHSKMTEMQIEGRKYLILPVEMYDRWEKQINTDYLDLTEKEKESDREQVRRYLPIIRQLLQSQREKMVVNFRAYFEANLLGGDDIYYCGKATLSADDVYEVLKEFINNQ